MSCFVFSLSSIEKLEIGKEKDYKVALVFETLWR